VLYGDDAFYTLLARVRDANATALMNTVGGAPSRVGIVPGAIAWDDCECGSGGLLALGTVRTYLSDEFPNELSEVTGGGSGVLICGDFSVQVIRCAPSQSSNGDAPSVDALDRSARVVNADGHAIICATIAILESMKSAYDIFDYLVRPVLYAGPEGACVGSELAFTAAVMR
jgi:hypothetical protein